MNILIKNVNTSNPLGNRTLHLDALKGTCILLVAFLSLCFTPTNSIIGNIFMCLAWSAIPCFMMTPGTLIHE